MDTILPTIILYNFLPSPRDQRIQGTKKQQWNLNYLVVSNIFYFHPYLGRWSNLTNIFQMGWFNHHLVKICYPGTIWHYLTQNSATAFHQGVAQCERRSISYLARMKWSKNLLLLIWLYYVAGIWDATISRRIFYKVRKKRESNLRLRQTDKCFVKHFLVVFQACPFLNDLIPFKNTPNSNICQVDYRRCWISTLLWVAAFIERSSFEPSVFSAGFSFSMLDKSVFYWLEAGFDFYKIAPVWRNLELIFHSSSLQRSLHPQKLTSPLKKRGHLENRKRIILKNHKFFRVQWLFV